MLRARPTIALVLVPALLLAACGASGPSSDAAASPTQAPVASSAAPSPSEPAASEEPTVSEAPASEQPSSSEAPSPSEEPSPSDATSSPAGTAGGCTGTDANREFFASVARAVAWPVYCAALPGGWFLATGTYRLANGGKLLVSYKGPGGATLALSEGTFCSDSSGCVPAGTETGDAVLGSMDGTFVALDDGGFAIVVNRGGIPSWLLEAHGIDEATTRALGEALFEVAG